MSALLTLMAVTKAAPITLDHLYVDAIMDSLWLVTVELVQVRYALIFNSICNIATYTPYMQMSMSALLTIVDVIKAVPTLLDHFSAAVSVATCSPVMEGLVWISMSVQQEHTTASKTVSTLLEDSDVNVTQAFNSTLIKELVLVYTAVGHSFLFQPVLP